MRFRGGLIAGALILMLVLGGCGSSSSSTSATSAVPTTGITKAEFVKRANAICVKGNAESKAAAAKLGANPSEGQVVTFVRSVEVPAVQAQIDAIRALGAPAGDAAKLAEMLKLAEHAVKEVRIQPTVISSGVDVFAGFAHIAHPYGLTSCAPKS
jgi:uncharacterized protein YceK